MKTVTISDSLYQWLQRKAQESAQTPDQVAEGLLRQQLEASETASDPFLGMWADEPELADAVVESAMQAREAHPLRTHG